MSDVFLSIVIPIYKSKSAFSELIDDIRGNLKFLGGKSYEIIVVEDGCPENSWEEIERKVTQVKELKGVKLSRNFGQHPSIKAGLSISQGEFIIVLDGDGQDNPKDIKRLLEEANKGFDIVYTIKKSRKHSFFKNLLARLFNFILNIVSDGKGDAKTLGLVGNFSLISRKVKDEFISLGDYKFHYLMVLRWLGFNSSFIKVEHNERKKGKSSYNFKSLIEHAITGITFSSEKVLRYNVYCGLIISILAFLAGTGMLLKYFIEGTISGTISLFVFGLFSLGLILFTFGVTGIYIGQIFAQVKNRKVYILEKIISQDSNYD